VGSASCQRKESNYGSEKKGEYDKEGVRKDAPDWFKRLVNEYRELVEKRTKLGKFLLTKPFPKEVSDIQRTRKIDAESSVRHVNCGAIYRKSGKGTIKYTRLEQ
jgi:hypothetical protein